MLSRDVTKKMSDEVVEICIWKTILPFFFVKTHFSSFFGSIAGFCQIRNFSNIRVRFFFNNTPKKLRVYYGLAPLRASNTNPNTHMVIFWGRYGVYP